MNIQEAKQIKIADYLLSLGHHPVKQQGANLWYKSPLRNESEPSFKVNTTMNSWFDFGMGKGGNIITMRHTSTHQTACHICWTSWRSKHPMCTRPTFLSLSKPPSRVLRYWRLGNSTILHSCAI